MKETVLIDVFWHAGFFLLLASLIIPFLRSLKIPTALGYLLAGIALGPHGLIMLSDHQLVLELIGLQNAEHVKILSELGIVLLLFVIGLELTPNRLWQMRHLVFGLGGTQVISTALVVGLIAWFWGNNIQVSLLLGFGFALSSTAIGIQWLQEQKLFATDAGRASFSILLFQDLAIIPILLLLTILSAEPEGGMLQYTLISLFKMGATVVVIFGIGRVVLKPLFIFANKYGGSEVFMALSLLVIVLSAYGAALAGLSMALGAFLAGLLLADTEYRHEIAALVTPFKSMLLGIFFFSFGMGINLSFIMDRPFWLLGSVIGLISIKIVMVFLICKLWRQTTAVAVETALLLAQAGEFGLMIVGTAVSTGLVAENAAQFMLLNIGLTMMLAPILAPVARKIGAYVERKTTAHKTTDTDNLSNKENHIVIFGFGRVGQSIANTLCEEGFQILGFDQNVQTVHHARKKGISIFLGDATRKTTLDAANLDRASCVVITVDDPDATKNSIRMIRQFSSIVPVIIRTHTYGDLDYFEDFEHIDVVAEDTVLSNSLSDMVLKLLGVIPESEKDVDPD